MLIIQFGSADFHLHLSEDVLVPLLETSRFESTSVRLLCMHAERERGWKERVISPGGCRGLRQRCLVPSRQLPPRLGRANPPAAPRLGQRADRAAMGTGRQAERSQQLGRAAARRNLPTSLLKSKERLRQVPPAVQPCLRLTIPTRLAGREGDVLHNPIPRVARASGLPESPARLRLRSTF